MTCLQVYNSVVCTERDSIRAYVRIGCGTLRHVIQQAVSRLQSKKTISGGAICPNGSSVNDNGLGLKMQLELVTS